MTTGDGKNVQVRGRRTQTNRLDHRDDDANGMSFIEVLVSVVLLGTAIVAVLAGMRATIMGSAIERDHARAQQWLQSSSEYLNDVVYDGCTTTNTAALITANYQNLLRTNPTATATVPQGWSPSQISIPSAVQFGGPGGVYGSTCFRPDINRQLIRIRVRDLNGDIVETVDVVKVPAP